MMKEDIISVCVALVLIIGLCYILYQMYKMMDCDKLSSHPNVQIGKKFEWRIYSDNPFEADSISIAEVIDLKEKNGRGWVQYKCQDHLYTESIYDFVTKYDKEV